jgi:hypothetical protein
MGAEMMQRGILTGLTVVMLLSGRGIALGACAGDCAGNGTVAVNELILGVNIALGNASTDQCPAFDTGGDHQVTVSELVAAVSNALNGCPFTGQYASFVAVGDGETATIHIQVDPDGQATGTLSVAASSSVRARPALMLEIPLLNLTGTVDLETGAYHLVGTVQGEDGDVPVDVSGSLPDRVSGGGTLQLDIGSETFTGTVVSGTGVPTPTRTVPATTATPTATGTPGSLPTEKPGCQGGIVQATITNVSGTNSYVDLGGELVLGPTTATVTGNLAFGGGTMPCHLMAGDLIRRFQYVVIATPVLGSHPLGPQKGTIDYLETPTSNPLGTRGWRSASGTLIVDAIEGGSVLFRVVDATMVPEPSFSFQSPATGTFTLNLIGRGKMP